MGGKHKQSQRTKNNAKPSSSGRSAELLGNTIPPFAGFSAFKEVKHLPTIFPMSTEGVDENVGTEFMLIIKKLTKKDPTTKTKALQEMAEVVKNSTVDEVNAALPYWVRLYKLLSTDTEHKVRDATQVAHAAIVKKCGRTIAPHLKQITPTWLTAQYDNFVPAATSAQLSLQSAFPEAKLPEMVSFCKAEVMSHIKNNLFSPETNAGPTYKSQTPEEPEARHQRIVMATLHGYSFFVKHLPDKHLEWLCQEQSTILESPKFWKLSTHKNEHIRAAWYSVIGRQIERVSEWFGKLYLTNVSKIIIDHLNEKDSLVATQIWDCFLLLVSNMQDWWSCTANKPGVSKQVLAAVKGGGWGNARHLAPILLPLLAHLPAEMLSREFYLEFFASMLSGIESKSILTSKAERQAWLTGFAECLRYVSLQKIDSFGSEIVPIQMRVWIDIALDSNPENQSMKNNLVKTSAVHMSSLVKFWIKQSLHSDLAQLYDGFIRNFWQNLCSTMLQQIDTLTPVPEEIKRISDCHVEFFVAFKTASQLENKKKASVKFASGDEVDVASVKCDKLEDDSLQTKAIQERYFHNLSSLVQEVCSRYLLFAQAKEVSTPILTPLYTLVTEFGSKELYTAMARDYMKSQNVENASLLIFYDGLWRKWLLDDAMRSRTVVDLIFGLLPFMELEEKKELFSSFKQFKPSVLEMCISKCLSHTHSSDVGVRLWMQSDLVDQSLISICRRLVREGDRHSKTLLKMCFSCDNSGELLISEKACSSIMSILRESLNNTTSQHLDMCASFSSQLVTTLSFEKKCSEFKQLLLQMFNLNCMIMPGDNISEDTWWEVKTSWRDALSTLDESDMTFFVVNSTKLLHEKLFSDNSKIEINEIDGFVNLSSNLTSGFIKRDLSVAENVSKLVTSADSLLKFEKDIETNKEIVYRAALKADIVLGRLNCPFVGENEILKSIVDDSNDKPSMELLLGEIVNYVKRCLFTAKYFKAVISKAAIMSDGKMESYDSDEEEEEKAERLAEEQSWSQGILEHSDVQSYLMNLLHDVIILYSLQSSYAFWTGYQIIPEQFKSLKTIFKHIVISMSQDVEAKFSQTLSEKATAHGYYWSMANEYYKKYLSSGKCQVNVLNVTEEMGKNTEIIFSGIGYFHNLQSHILDSRKSNTESIDQTFTVKAMLAMRCLYLAQSKKKIELSDEEINQCFNEKYGCLTVIVNKYYAEKSTMLYDRDLTQDDWSSVYSNVAILELLDTAVQYGGWDLLDIHWDFIMITLSSLLHSLEKSRRSWNSTKVVLLGCPLLKLYNTVEKFISDIPATCLKREPSPVIVNLPEEWKDIFMPDMHEHILKVVVYIFEESIPSSDTVHANSVIFLNTLHQTIQRLNWKNLPTNSQAGSLTVDAVLASCLKIFDSPCNHVLKFCSYVTLKLLRETFSESDASIIATFSSNGEQLIDEERTMPDLSLKKFESVLCNLQEIMDVALGLCNLCEESCLMVPFTDSYNMGLGYLLLWEFLFDICQASSGDHLQQYIEFFRKNKNIEFLAPNLLRMMPMAIIQGKENTSLKLTVCGTVTTYADLFKVMPKLDGEVHPAPELLSWLSCHILYCSMSNGGCAPLVRGWWGATGSRTSRCVDRIISTNISVPIIKRLLNEVIANQSTLKDVQTTVHWSVNEMISTYTVDDRKMELNIQLYSNHPLGIPKVLSIGTPVNHSQWISMFLSYQNGTLLQAINLWLDSVQRKLEGAPVCYVCYCRLHPTSGLLPKILCRTCKNKFHNTCLYKWFHTSNKSSCPICRNLF